MASDESNPNLGTDTFDSEILEAARLYHLQCAHSQAKGYVPAEVAAFIAGACWARLVFERREKGDKI
jgi:hypothetical protein